MNLLKILTLCILALGSMSAGRQMTKRVWTYIDLEMMTVLQELSIDNIRRYSTQSGFTLQLITNVNYTSIIQDNSDLSNLANVVSLSHLDRDVTFKNLLQLIILAKYGGVWIDANSMLTQGLQWLGYIQNAKNINNRIENPDVVMFYQPGWFDQTFQKIEGKKEKVVLIPYYQSWFMRANAGTVFISELKAKFIETVIMSYEKLSDDMGKKNITLGDYLQNQEEYLPWLIRTMIQIQQNELDQKKPAARQLAINYYLISGVDADQTVSVVDKYAKGHVHLISKYLAELTAHQVEVKLTYGIKFSGKVRRELLQTFEPDFVNLDHYHAAGDLLCDGESIPLRYIVKGSILDRHLLQNHQNNSVVVYDEEFIKHHCESSFVQVYLILGKYILFIALIVGHVFVTRKAILFFKPEWGRSKKVIQFEESHL